MNGTENEYSIYARSPSYVWNPVAAVKRYDDYTDQYNLNTNGYLQYQPIKGLVIRTQASIEVGDKTQSIFRPDFIIDAAHEKAEINTNVLAFEPHLALFVSDEDPLIFYRKIAELALKNLKPNGLLFFEINQYLGKETVSLLADLGFATIELRKDIYGNDRMIKAEFR